MDINKKFTEFLSEDTVTNLKTSGNVELGTLPEEEQRWISMLNSSIADLASSPYVNVYYGVQRIRDRVQAAFGLTFEDRILRGDSGSESFTLKPLYHVDVHNQAKNVYTHDNGFLKLFSSADRPYNLQLVVSYVKYKNIYHIEARIDTVSPVVIAVAEEK